MEEEASVDLGQVKTEFQEKARAYLVEQAAHVIIPSFSKWFNLDEVHSIEEKSFPDFFGDSGSRSIYKSPEIYKNIRDFMVNAYRINPIEYLTVTAVRRNLAGDVASIIRIHQFLEKWGLINYQIDPKTKPSIVGPQYTGHFQITLDTPTGLLPLIPENAKIVNDKESKLPPPSESESKKEASSNALNLEVRRNIYTTSNSKITGKNNTIVQYFCNICGKDATTVRYHNLRIKTYTHNSSSTINNASILCHLCYDQGLFPLNFQASDFVRLQKSDEAAEWSEQEVLLLLEGIEMFGTLDSSANAANGSIFTNTNGQWEKISEHVGSKTREQCLIKFVQLPIEDKYLNRIVDDAKKKDTTVIKNENLIADIVKKIVKDQEGRNIVKSNAHDNLQESILEQSNLINQITELTLEKFSHKLKKLDTLQENLLKIENQLNLERKQVLIERWVQYEKIQNLKEQRPELTEVLDDLIKPVRVNEINKSLNPLKSEKNRDSSESEGQKVNQGEIDKLPISVSKPKSYQYWSG
ncbi:eighth largest subunit of RSC [Suhomyces tanzawaensis NRRL Y-17324]|uniref:Eighth largest subunit of RSC n=1 Tax=Suhomyces tanzawaensis NRRL Y-17324 TaxID=984487 RepID=A0A1E4SEC8_9ASCO|nr:eighth largest subunit of RSC [Suhomyces tanzawaensis NRRL Y-17324]ODV77865.1 eighth largest subunit of RSC [Suhomyces tanzawaensis NRRL Y-17324]